MTSYQFINRVYHYPIVYDTCSQVVSTYSNIKTTNRIVEGALNMAEGCVNTAAAISTPIVANTFENQLNGIDRYGCGKLNDLEQSYPVVLKPTQEVFKTAQEAVVNSSIVLRANGYKDMIENNAQQRGDQVLTAVENLVENYLPEDDATKSEKDKDDDYEREKKALWDHTMRVIRKIRFRIAQRGQSTVQQCTGKGIAVLEAVNKTNQYAQEIRNAYEDFHAKYQELQRCSADESAQVYIVCDAYSDTSSTSTNLELNETGRNRLLNAFHDLNERTRQLIVSYATMGWTAALAASSVGYERLSETNQKRLDNAISILNDLTVSCGKKISDANISATGQGPFALLQYILLSPISWLPYIAVLVKEESETPIIEQLAPSPPTDYNHVKEFVDQIGNIEIPESEPSNELPEVTESEDTLASSNNSIPQSLPKEMPQINYTKNDLLIDDDSSSGDDY